MEEAWSRILVKLVSYFLKEKALVGYTSHKLALKPRLLLKPKPLYITPDEDASWTKKPLIILQDRSSLQCHK